MELLTKALKLGKRVATNSWAMVATFTPVERRICQVGPILKHVMIPVKCDVCGLPPRASYSGPTDADWFVNLMIPSLT
jgi:hypothetical protein